MRRNLLVVLSLIAGMWAAVPPAIAAPSNDRMANPTIIGGVPAVSLRDTRGATVESGEYACKTPVSASVWYRLPLTGGIGGLGANASDPYLKTNTHNVYAVMSTLGSNYDTVISVYDGIPSSTTLVGCNDDITGSTQSSLSLTLVAGHTYNISITGKGASHPGGDLRFSINRQPHNDFIGEAYDAPLITNRFVGSNVGATLEPNENRSCSNLSNTLWYKRHVTVNEKLRADTFGSSFKTAVGVFVQYPNGTFGYVGCGIGTIEITATAGNVYLFQVGNDIDREAGGVLVFSLAKV